MTPRRDFDLQYRIWSNRTLDRLAKRYPDVPYTDREDAVQAAIAWLLENHSKDLPTEGICRCLPKTAEWKLIDGLRRGRVSREASGDPRILSAGEPTLPEDAILYSEVVQAINEARTITYRTKQAMMMTLLGETVQAIAATLRISVACCRKKIARGIREMRRLLAGSR